MTDSEPGNYTDLARTQDISVHMRLLHITEPMLAALGITCMQYFLTVWLCFWKNLKIYKRIQATTQITDSYLSQYRVGEV